MRVGEVGGPIALRVFRPPTEAVHATAGSGVYGIAVVAGIECWHGFGIVVDGNESVG